MPIDNQPLVAADVDLTDFPFMPIMVARLKQSRAWLICKRKPELAFYMLNLWTASWHGRPAASLEDDDLVLSDLAMCNERAWPKVKADILRGWVKCTDGRLYHPVVAEQALEAWARKTAQRNRTEAARLAKEAARLARLNADRLVVDGHIHPTEPVTNSVTENATEDVTGSKGQGQGQGQGQGHSLRGGDARPTANDLYAKLIAAAGGRVDSTSVAIEIVGPIEDLIAQGCDLDRHVLATIGRIVPSLEKPLRTWNARWLRDEILAAKAADGDRIFPPKNTEPKVNFGGGYEWPESSVVAAVERWRKDPLTWPEKIGPAPGRDGCRVPAHLLQASEAA